MPGDTSQTQCLEEYTVKNLIGSLVNRKGHKKRCVILLYKKSQNKFNFINKIITDMSQSSLKYFDLIFALRKVLSPSLITITVYVV